MRDKRVAALTRTSSAPRRRRGRRWRRAVVPAAGGARRHALRRRGGAGAAAGAVRRGAAAVPATAARGASAPAAAPAALRRARRGRRVEQHRVLAHQAADGPGGFEDHVDERLLHRAVAGHAQERAAVGAPRAASPAAPAARRCTRRRRRGRPRAARCATAARRLFGRHAGDVDLGPQRFAERRLHGQPAQARAPRLRAPQDRRRRAATPVSAKRAAFVERFFKASPTGDRPRAAVEPRLSIVVMPPPTDCAHAETAEITIASSI